MWTRTACHIGNTGGRFPFFGFKSDVIKRLYSKGFPTLFDVSYDSHRVESYWRNYWKTNLYPYSKDFGNGNKDRGSKNFYVLSMFPYPSGSLHIGHARVYTISDLLSRAFRMKGLNVFHPMGWDAFGLPAENAAIERDIRPSIWTKSNIAHMKTQMSVLGFEFDWKHELDTSDPEYYKWTQWIFLKMYERGLAYQMESHVNWDPVDQTVLANEQVDSNGRSWRSGALVEKKLMRQWYLKITEYTEYLLKGLDSMTGWPPQVTKMQKEWINESLGYVVKFEIFESEDQLPLEIFTTRLETIFGCTFLVLGVGHDLVLKITSKEQKAAVDDFVKRCSTQTSSTAHKRELDGVFTGSYAINPMSREKVPIYLSNYVISEYATGSVMGVPAHDLRDLNFARMNDLPIRQVLEKPPFSVESPLPIATSSESLEDFVLFNSGELSGKSVEEAQSAIFHIGFHQNWIEKKKFYNLKDWLISRQRYWGTPIPIIYCEHCGVVPVPEDQLPVKLPDDEKLCLRTQGSPLANVRSWYTCKCPSCGKDARRETDTMDTFVDSSFYYIRFPDSHNPHSLIGKDKSNEWLPVDIYVGGIEHAILHLLYSRFVNKFLHGLDVIPSEMPFSTVLTQGMIHGKTYRMVNSNKPVASSDFEEIGDQAFHIHTGQPLSVTWEKMSKSKYNGVDPHQIVEEYGADVTRLYLLFKAPIDQVIKWDSSQIRGQLRWLCRVWKIVQHYQIYRFYNRDGSSASSQRIFEQRNELRSFVHETIKFITKSFFEDYSFNISIARLMDLSNRLAKIARGKESNLLISFEKNELLESHEYREAIESLLLMLAPIAPHFASEIWRILHADPHSPNPSLPDIHILNRSWPSYNPEYIDKSSIEDNMYTVLICGRKVKKIHLSPTMAADSQAFVEHLKTLPEIQNRLLNKKIKKVFYIEKSRLINFVI